MLYTKQISGTRKAIYLAVFSLTMAAIVSCKKEYTAYPYNTIETFTLKDASGNPLEAAISDNEIIVYWPPFQSVPDSVTPTITVARNASVQPASGARVPFNTATVYTVTAQDGSKQTYTLKPSVNQAPVTFNDLNNNTFTLGSSFTINGEYIIRDTAVTSLFLTNVKTGKQSRLFLSTASVFTYSRISMTLPLNAGIDTGLHTVTLKSGARSVTKGPYYINRPAMAYTDFTFNPKGGNVKRGDEVSFTFDATTPKAQYWNNTFAHCEFSILSVYYRVEIVKQSAGSVTLKIPAGIPAGEVEFVRGVSQSTGAGTTPTVTVYYPLTPAEYIKILN